MLDVRCECKCKCSAPTVDELDKLLRSYDPRHPDNLISLLQDTQDIYGYIPEDSLRRIARFYDTSASKIYGVATFYNQFRLQPPGKHVIRVCRGTACHVRGSKGIQLAFEAELGIKAGDTTRDRLFTLETVACIGACGLAPVITVGDEAHGRMTPEKVIEVINRYRG